MSKHVITGGAGFIGSNLARRLVSAGEDVVAVDNLLSGSVRNLGDLRDCDNFKFVAADLRDEKKCIAVTKGADYLWALAANMGGIQVITQIGADIMRDNTRLNVNALEACRINKIPHYFYSSSACIYPEYKQLDANVIPLKESDAYPASPDQFYGWEKIFTEQCCMAYQKDYGLNIRIVRFHNIFGECFTSFDSFKAKAPGQMIIKAIRYPKETIEIWNDGKQTRSFCYIDDCIDGILKLMDSDYNKPINIGTDRMVTMIELAGIVAKASGKNIVPKFYPDKPLGVRGRNADLTLVKQVLGWQPKVSLEDGVKRTYEWAVQHYAELEGI